MIMQNIPALAAIPANDSTSIVDNIQSIKQEPDVIIKIEEPNVTETHQDVSNFISDTESTEHKPNLTQYEVLNRDAEFFSCVYCHFESNALPVFERHMVTEHMANAGREIRSDVDNSSVVNGEVTPQSVTADNSDPEIHTDIDILAVVKREVEVHECRECSFMSEDEAAFKHHIKNRHEFSREIYKCGICKYATTSKLYFSRHLKNEHEGNVQVGKRFIVQRLKDVEDNSNKYLTYPKMANSIKKTNKPVDDKKYKCNHCVYAAKWLYTLYFHLRTVHLQEYTTNICMECHYSTGEPSEFVNHIRNEHRQNIFQCKHCNYVCTSVASMNMHKNVAHKKLHRCQSCDYVSNKSSDLTRHMSIHQTNVYKCDLCPLKTTHLVYLSRHIKRVHASQSNTASAGKHVVTLQDKHEYRCDYCTLPCSSKEAWFMHMRSVHGFSLISKQQKPMQFNAESTTNMDISKTTNNDSPIEEHRCNYPTASEEPLVLHVENEHNGLEANKSKGDTSINEHQYDDINKEDKSENIEYTISSKNDQSLVEIEIYKCNICDYTTTSENHFSEHKRTHYEVTVSKYNCSFCIFTTDIETALEFHIKTLHSNESKTIDDNRFGDENTMQCDDVLTPEQDTKDFIIQTYECSECSCSYENEVYLNEHLELLHSKGNLVLENDVDSKSAINICDGMRTYKCQDCDYITEEEANLTQHVQNRVCIKSNLNGSDNINTAALNKEDDCSKCIETSKTEELKSEPVPNTTKWYKCMCDFSTKKKIILVRHLKKCDPSVANSKPKLRALEQSEDKEPKKQSERKNTKRYNTRSCLESVKTEMYKCTLCSFKCRRKLVLTTHLEKTHNTNLELLSQHKPVLVGKFLQCKSCSYRTSRRYDLAKHVAIRHDANAPIYKCPKCPWTTKWNTYLTHHIKLSHPETCNGMKSRFECHKCPTCDYSTAHKPDLFKHATEMHILNSNHSTVDAKNDELCKNDESFSGENIFRESAPSDLRKDEKTTCPLCEYSTDDKLSFKNHISQHILF